MKNEAPPAISIITATYNRANVLRLCLDSVRDQTRTDWELIVVGDHCTDDSGAVVASFNEPRFRWVNLDRNFGEQSGPNNEGFARARGKWIAYLNHDDFWFPDHLERAVRALEDAGADLAFTRAARLRPDGQVLLTGRPLGVYDWNTLAPATTVVMRRQVLEATGGWRPGRDLFNVPSQDLLYRAHRRGFRTVAVPEITAVLIESAPRKGSYTAGYPLDEYEAALRALRSDPERYREELRSAAGTGPRVSPLRSLANRLLFQAGIHPISISFLLSYGWKGGAIRRYRRTRGLSPLPL